jgi:hypothetical protein
MAKVFISYASPDRDLAQSLAEKLVGAGHSVWWDHGLASGDNFRKRILQELAQADKVVVIWTKRSIESEWVVSEASRAAALNKLVPLKEPDIDLHDIPPPFDTYHTDLVIW